MLMEKTNSKMCLHLLAGICDFLLFKQYYYCVAFCLFISFIYFVSMNSPNSSNQDLQNKNIINQNRIHKYSNTVYRQRINTNHDITELTVTSPSFFPLNSLEFSKSFYRFWNIRKYSKSIWNFVGKCFQKSEI